MYSKQPNFALTHYESSLPRCTFLLTNIVTFSSHPYRYLPLCFLRQSMIDLPQSLFETAQFLRLIWPHYSLLMPILQMMAKESGVSKDFLYSALLPIMYFKTWKGVAKIVDLQYFQEVQMSLHIAFHMSPSTRIERLSISDRKEMSRAK